MSTIADLLFNAAVEINAARAGDALAPEDQTLLLYLLNEMLDEWNVRTPALYATQKPIFTLQTNHQPHTIGTAANGADLVVSTARPTRILEANLIIGNNIRKPINIRDDQWWMSLQAPQITASISSDLWYSDDWPNGSIYLYPIITTAWRLELLLEFLLASVSAGDDFDMPMGYQSALRLSLAERAAPSFGQMTPVGLQSLMTRARDARAAIFGNNQTPIPRISTRDGGMPGGPSGSDALSFIYTGFSSP